MTEPKKTSINLDLSDPLLQEKLEAIQAGILAQADHKVRKLGKILRRRSIFSLRRFLADNGLMGKLQRDDLPLFMEYLITQRIDLKDMHEEARARLREHTLQDQPSYLKTPDYKHFVEELGEPVHCRDCAWFVQAPPGEEKSCVQLGGTKGADAPCIGFTMKKSA